MGERFPIAEVLSIITHEEEQAIARFEQGAPVSVGRHGGEIETIGWTFDSLVGNSVFVKKLETNEGKYVPVAEFLAINAEHIDV